MPQFPAIKGEQATYYHYDHSMGDAFYGAQGVPLRAHAMTAKRIIDSYTPLQRA